MKLLRLALAAALVLHAALSTPYWENLGRAFTSDGMSYEQRRMIHAFMGLPVDHVKAALNAILPAETPIALGETIRKDSFMHQRMTEALYPRRIDQKAAKTIGWRVDDIAGLAVAIAYILSKQGKAPRTDVEKLLQEKLPGWRVKMSIDRYIQQGYLGEDEKGVLYMDWRSRAEVDQKQLIDLIVSFGKKTDSQAPKPTADEEEED